MFDTEAREAEIARPLSEHPMDAITVRPLDFNADHLGPEGAVWSQSSPEFAIYINAMAVHIPYFERYLGRSMMRARKHLTDERLQRDAGAITGQEAHHARNFIAYNRFLAKRYPKVERLDKEAKTYFAERAKTDSLKRIVGFTAGYETFTFLAGMLILANYEKWLQDSEPTMKAMWVWHQVEEVEHGAVAFEVYKALYGDHELYRKWMIVVALTHIAKETLRLYFHMCRIEGFYRKPVKAVTSTWFVFETLAAMAWHALPTFSKTYHPRNHPLGSTEESRIAVAWRRYIKNGGDVLTIDRAKMSEIVQTI
jgi:uncharacterized protein